MDSAHPPISATPPYPPPPDVNLLDTVRKLPTSDKPDTNSSRSNSSVTPYLDAQSCNPTGERLPYIQTHRFELGKLFEGMTSPQPTTPRFAARAAPERKVQLPVVARVVDDDRPNLKPLREPESS